MKIIILDRDGVINYDREDFIKTPDEWLPIPGSIEAIAKLNHLGYTIVVCTNQSGIGRKLFTLDTLTQIHKKMQTLVESHGGKIDSIFYCPHLPTDNCNCRKPKTQMIQDICAKYNLPNADDIMMVGDSLRDLLTINNAGGIPVLVKTGNGIKTINDGKIPGNSMVFESLSDFSQYINNKVKG